MLDARRLRVLIEVVERGSFSAAADALHLTQPSVSRHVASLEREVGVPLLRRGPELTLTQAGETLVAGGREALRQLDGAEAELRAITGLTRGRICIGSFASANTFLVPEAIRRFKRRFSGVELSLTADPPEDHVDGVSHGAVDLALVAEWDARRARRASGLRLEPLLVDELLLALGRDHRLAGQERIELRDLADETWIEGSHPDCLGPLVALCRRAGYEPRIGLTCEDWSGKQGLVASGVGITLFPSLALDNVHADLVLRPIADGFPSRRVYALVPEQPLRAPAVDPFLALLREVSADQCVRYTARFG
jgi:DNA-binding transcriptional LysR family regulator